MDRGGIILPIFLMEKLRSGKCQGSRTCDSPPSSACALSGGWKKSLSEPMNPAFYLGRGSFFQPSCQHFHLGRRWARHLQKSDRGNGGGTFAKGGAASPPGFARLPIIPRWVDVPLCPPPSPCILEMSFLARGKVGFGLRW